MLCGPRVHTTMASCPHDNGLVAVSLAHGRPRANPRSWLSFTGRGGGNRTHNLWFWRPALCQLSYAPVAARRRQARFDSWPPSPATVAFTGGFRFAFGPALAAQERSTPAAFCTLGSQSTYSRIPSSYSRILVTTPEPTVLPPSRMAKRTPSSMAIGEPSSTDSRALSPGMHISASPINFAAPVTSVVRK